MDLEQMKANAKQPFEKSNKKLGRTKHVYLAFQIFAYFLYVRALTNNTHLFDGFILTEIPPGNMYLVFLPFIAPTCILVIAAIARLTTQYQINKNTKEIARIASCPDEKALDDWRKRTYKDKQRPVQPTTPRVPNKGKLINISFRRWRRTN